MRAAVAIAVLTSGCFQPVDVGFNFQPDGSDAGFSDAGFDGGACPAGDVTINNAQEWADFVQKRCLRVDGSLYVYLNDMTALTADVLQTVTGHLWIMHTTLESVSFPELTTIGGDLSLASFNFLISASFPKLQSILSLNLVESRLTTLELGSLTQVGGHLAVQMNALTTLSLPVLRRVGGAYLTFEAGPALMGVSLPALQTVAGQLNVVGSGLPSLTTLSLPALTSTWGLNVGSSALTALELPALTRVNAISIHDNPQLRQCQVDAIKLGLTTAPATYEANRNDGMPNICP